MKAVSEFLSLLQISAVVLVASVFLLAASADLFALDAAGMEPGGGRMVFTLRYRGWTADTIRHMIFGTGLIMVATYTTLIPAIVLDSFFPGLFSTSLLAKFAIFVTGFIIFAICWVVFLAIILRWIKMRNDGANNALTQRA